ncbi:hypothetical protein [Planococcus sp. YIM B11945]|uniref:hypothetical protein n=1 Tax=Planococcus sp. YIM B11945 TaxID=3435410 RepID=UPI003D7EC050
MKIRHSLLTITSILLLTGCTNASNEMATVVEEVSTDFPPKMAGLVNIEGEIYEMEEGNSRWERKKGAETETVLTDAPSPSKLAEDFPAIALEPSTNIVIEIEGNPKQRVYLWTEEDRDKDIVLENNQFTAPSSKGRYTYEVLANWKNGEVSYTFVVEVD